MTKASVKDWNGKKVRDIELKTDVFGHPLRMDLMQAHVRWQLASRRQGTHNTKSRGEVSGGGRKPFRQKGTGNARQGTSRSPLMPGGAITFGPKPRDYSYALPKKMRRKALKMALSYLVKEGRFFVVPDMTSKDGKTKELSLRLKKFGLQKSLLVDNQRDGLFHRAAKNLKNFRYDSVEGVNVYDLLKFDAAIVTEKAVEGLTKRCGGEK